MKRLIRARSAMPSRPMVAVMAIAGMAFAACGGSAAAPGPTSSPAPSAAPLDACLVGTWTVVAQDQSSPANDEQITYSGGTGEVFTIDADGHVTIDTQAAQKLALRDWAGNTFTGVVAGTGRGTLSTLTGGDSHFLFFTPSADDTRTTHSFDSTGTELGPARPDTPFSAIYTCAPGRFTFYKSSVNYMVDGPIVTLTSGSGHASSTASPSPS